MVSILRYYMQYLLRWQNRSNTNFILNDHVYRARVCAAHVLQLHDSTETFTQLYMEEITSWLGLLAA